MYSWKVKKKVIDPIKCVIENEFDKKWILKNAVKKGFNVCN